jgi:hypothetical protein
MGEIPPPQLHELTFRNELGPNSNSNIASESHLDQLLGHQDYPHTGSNS